MRLIYNIGQCVLSIDCCTDCNIVSGVWDKASNLGPPTKWHRPFVIGLFKHSLGECNELVTNSGLSWLAEIPTVFKSLWQSPCTGLTAGKCLPLRLCKETVNASMLSTAVEHRGRQTSSKPQASPHCVIPQIMPANKLAEKPVLVAGIGYSQVTHALW